MNIGFLVNPIAGMGGKVGLKGTDGVLQEAIDRGAEPVAKERAKETIKRYIFLKQQSEKQNENVTWYTCAGTMGFDILAELKLQDTVGENVQVVYEPKDTNQTTVGDTKSACEKFIKASVELILFCGGDGTARDVFSVVKDSVPILGIPAGVKMHSGVFAMHARTAGTLLVDYIKGEMDTADGEILDLDEDKYRKGEWNIRLFGSAKTPFEPTIIQCGKHMVESASEDEIKEEIAEYIEEEMKKDPDILYVMGSGSTVHAITKHLGISGTLLGVDGLYQNKLIGIDMNEKQLLNALDEHPNAKLIISPIGAQGFILGRGNLQISPKVIRKIGIDNINVISTPAKLNELVSLRVDTNDPELDKIFEEKGWFTVIVGYAQMKLKKIAV